MTFNPTFVGQVTSNGNQPTSKGNPLYLLARVTHVVNGPFFQGTKFPDPNYKDPSDIGSILYQLVNTTQNRTTQASGNPLAKPVNSSIKQYPVEGEFVLLMQGPSTEMNTSRDSRQYFYTLPFNLWNASHHNAFPDMTDYSAFSNTTRRTYQQTSIAQQPSNVSTTSSVNFPLGPNFPEKSNIKSLRPFAGDLTLEGRWGNSIRFGSTSAIDKQANYWSSGPSEPGSPITIIRNGQGRQEDNLAWFPTVENINTDPSSIYLTNGQIVTIDDIDSNFSLASLGIQIKNTQTNVIPIQQQLTSTTNISPLEQDKRLNSPT
jgi:hypothetical protein